MEQPIREIFDQFKQQLPDIDPVETQEWLDSLDDIVETGTGSSNFDWAAGDEAVRKAAGAAGVVRPQFEAGDLGKLKYGRLQLSEQLSTPR